MAVKRVVTKRNVRVAKLVFHTTHVALSGFATLPAAIAEVLATEVGAEAAQLAIEAVGEQLANATPTPEPEPEPPVIDFDEGNYAEAVLAGLTVAAVTGAVNSKKVKEAARKAFNSLSRNVVDRLWATACVAADHASKAAKSTSEAAAKVWKKTVVIVFAGLIAAAAAATTSKAAWEAIKDDVTKAATEQVVEQASQPGKEDIVKRIQDPEHAEAYKELLRKQLAPKIQGMVEEVIEKGATELAESLLNRQNRNDPHND